MDLAVDFQWIAQGLFIGDEGYLGRGEARRAHVDTHLAVVAHVQLDDAAFGFHADALLGGQALVQHEAGETARTVAALLDLGTVGIEDPIAEVHVRVVRRLDDQQLVEADAGVAVTPLLGMLGLDVRVLADRSGTMKSLPSPCILVKRSSMVSLRQQAFAGEQFGNGFPATDFESLVAIDQHFGAAATGVVVRAHDKTIGAGGLNGQQIAFGQVQYAVLGQEVAGFADRTDQS